jgi:hypothetical protein
VKVLQTLLGNRRRRSHWTATGTSSLTTWGVARTLSTRPLELLRHACGTLALSRRCRLTKMASDQRFPVPSVRFELTLYGF